MLQPVRLNQSKGILKISLMEKYLKNLDQGTSSVSNFSAIDNNKSLTYDIKTMSRVFKDFCPNLAESFLAKLPDP